MEAGAMAWGLCRRHGIRQGSCGSVPGGMNRTNLQQRALHLLLLLFFKQRVVFRETLDQQGAVQSYVLFRDLSSAMWARARGVDLELVVPDLVVVPLGLGQPPAEGQAGPGGRVPPGPGLQAPGLGVNQSFLLRAAGVLDARERVPALRPAPGPVLVLEERSGGERPDAGPGGVSRCGAARGGRAAGSGARGSGVAPGPPPPHPHDVRGPLEARRVAVLLGHVLERGPVPPPRDCSVFRALQIWRAA